MNLSRPNLYLAYDDSPASLSPRPCSWGQDAVRRNRSVPCLWGKPHLSHSLGRERFKTRGVTRLGSIGARLSRNVAPVPVASRRASVCGDAALSETDT